MGFGRIQNPDLTARLLKITGAKGHGATSPTVATEIVPVIIVADVERQEIQPGLRTFYRGGLELIVAGANVFVRVSLINPAGSGITARVKKVHCSTTGGVPIAADILVGPTFASDVPGARWPCNALAWPQGGPTLSSACAIGSAVGAGAQITGSTNLWYQEDVTSIGFTVELEDCVLVPGASVIVGNRAAMLVTQKFAGAFEWAEERAFKV